MCVAGVPLFDLQFSQSVSCDSHSTVVSREEHYESECSFLLELTCIVEKIPFPRFILVNDITSKVIHQANDWRRTLALQYKMEE